MIKNFLANDAKAMSIRASRLASYIVIVFGFATLLGWWTNTEFLKSFLSSNRVAMNPLTALCFLFCGLALRDEAKVGKQKWFNFIPKSFAPLTALSGAICLIAYATGWNFEIDKIMFSAQLHGNQMAPNTAFCFVLSGIAITLKDIKFFKFRLTPLLVIISAGVSVLALTGYLYSVLPLYRFETFIPMALNTALAFIVLNVGVLTANPSIEPLSIILSDTLGGWVARRLIPVALIVPLFASWMRLLGERVGLYNRMLGVTIFALANTLFWVGLLWFTVRHLFRIDLLNQSLQDELLVAREKAIKDSHAKSDFLANMSHEIRTPMNGVLGTVRLLLNTNLGIKQKSYADLIHRSAQSLLVLINDILDFSKIEAGKLTLEIIDFDLSELIKDAEDILTYSANLKGNRISIEFDSFIPQSLKGDPNRLRQILVNLMSNAIKFTDHGVITVEIRMIEGKSNNNKQIKFEVKDTGIGISPENCRKLFQKFSQVDASTTRKYGGTGLGLSISKHLVVMMGGEIGVESKEGEGSTFWFKVPLEMGEIKTEFSRDQKCCNKENYRKGRVLVVDDNKTNQFVATEFLQKLGHYTVAVNNGKEALDILMNESFDLILMDCQMPVMNGYEATQKIREKEKQGNLSRMPIWALTADAMSGDYKKAILSGMDGYLTKPINFKKLAETIEGCLSKKTDKIVGSVNWSVMDEVNKYSSPGTDISTELIKIFLETTPIAISKIESAIKKEDFELLKQQAHYLKSSCGNLGADTMRLICEKFENIESSSARLRLSEAQSLFESLKNEYELVIIELDTSLKSLITPAKVS
jgi:signal transduction histidine kinase/DNA-binding response OmpR family regulator